MKAIKSYKYSFILASRTYRMNSVIYLIYLTIALLLTIPFYRLFLGATENSILPTALVKGFDATAFVEIIRHSGKLFAVYVKGFWPWILAFWILGTWFYGGIIARVANPSGAFRMGFFLKNCRKNFWRFFKLALYMLILQLVLAVLVYLLPLILIGRENLTDSYIVRTLTLAVVVHLLVMMLLSWIADMTRIVLYQNKEKKVLRNLWKSTRFVFKNLASFLLMYFLWMILPVVLILGFYLIRLNWIAETTGMILLVFLVQQIFIWLRFAIRIQRQGMFLKFFSLSQLAV